jgi:hypothetical protein
MSELAFSVLGVRAEKHAAVPTLMFRLRIDETTGTAVHAILLRSQIRIEPQRRRYAALEQQNLLGLFGEPARWGDTQRSFLWTHATLNVPGFERSLEIELPITCTYDLEVTAAKYFQALEGGEVPLLLLFSGTIFAERENGYSVQQVPWDKEATCKLPLSLWRELMDAYFPDCGWIRVGRESLNALQRFRAERALLTWDATFAALIEGAKEQVP